MEYLAVLLPSLGLGILFWFIMRWIFRADRTERQSRARSQEDAREWYEEIKERDDLRDPFGQETGKSR